MKKWEYDVTMHYVEGNNLLRYQKRGQDGWEMCGMQWSDSVGIVVWKREIEAGKEIEKSDSVDNSKSQ